MKPELLPVNEYPTNLIDYTHGVITRHYRLGDSNYYFSLHPELYPQDDALDFTGRYLAVLLSIRGLETFYLELDDTGIYVMYDESEADRFEEEDMEVVFPEIKGIHVEEDEAEADEEIAEDDTMNWMQFDSEKEIVPLMNTAIQEHRKQ